MNFDKILIAATALLAVVARFTPANATAALVAVFGTVFGKPWHNGVGAHAAAVL